jgi:hypothetical protein
MRVRSSLELKITLSYASQSAVRACSTMTSPTIDAHKNSGNRPTTASASPDLVDPDILKKASLTNVTDAELELPRPSWLQKHILLAAIRLVGKFRRHTGSCLMLTKDLCVKYGSRIYLVEAQSMIYVARHTTIPVPVVHLAFTHKGCTYILMERIHAQSLRIGWLQRPLDSKLKVLGSLKDIILEMIRSCRNQRNQRLSAWVLLGCAAEIFGYLRRRLRGRQFVTRETTYTALQDVRERITLGNRGIHGLSVTVPRVAAAAKLEYLKTLSAVTQWLTGYRHLRRNTLTAM